MQKPFNQNKTQLIVALDIPCLDKALSMVDLLGDDIHFYKVGPVLFSVAGPQIIDFLIRRNKKVFVDLKFHDIPSVVAQSCEQIANLGASLITVHISSGKSAIQLSLESLEKFPQCALLGVGILTSLDQQDLIQIGSFDNIELPQISEKLLFNGLEWGLHGVVCSAHNLPNLKKHFPQKITLITGVRKQESSQDQKRISAVENFFSTAPKYVVVGRPILNSLDPVKTALEFLTDLESFS